METADISDPADGASALRQEYQSSNSYDPAQAEPAVSAVLSHDSATPVDPSKPNISVPDITSQSALTDPSTAIAALDSAVDRQSQSRSMSRGSSSAGSSSNIIITEQTMSTHPAQDAEQGVQPTVNGGPVSSSAASRVPAPIDPSKSAPPASTDAEDIAAKATPNHFPDTAAETPLGTPNQTASDAPPVPAKTSNQITSSTTNALPKARLPHDKMGILEDRIKEDPRGDIEAWLNLINEHKNRAKLDDARATYDKFLALFPSAAEIWLSYAQMENEANERNKIDNVLGKSLMQAPYLPLWSMYLDHVRRHNNLATDTTGTARQVIHQAYDLALRQVGLDKDSGRMWQDYILFIKSGPGILGGSNWQDQQKMDLLRKIYQQAICVPTQATNALWKEYDGFEMGLNKMTGRKFLQDQSPAYMSARASYTELQNITRNLKRSTLPSLPPALGFEGDVDYMEQLDIWKRWIQWEKDDPLVLEKEDKNAYRTRVVFVYKHALMAMRFWPELWYDASEFCFANEMENEGNDFLVQGIAANPESCLLAFKRADRIELTTSAEKEKGDEKRLRCAALVREPYDKVLDALYDLIAKSKSREERDLALIEVEFQASTSDPQPNGVKEEEKDEEDEEAQQVESQRREQQKKDQIEATKSVHAVQLRLLSRTLSHVWIALMRALRRVQGKGGVGVGGARGVFSDARKRGRITSDVYVQAALIEIHCYDADTGKKIFERGLKLFQEDEVFALEYLKFLVATNDHNHARVVFQNVATRLSQKPETTAKAKPLFAFFHGFLCRYDELDQIIQLEQRMHDLFPEDPSLAIFSRRFADDGFDPTAIRPIISPAKQTRPKAVPTIQTTSPPVQLSHILGNSPKRPLPQDESDNESDRPRKAIRGVSPFKPAPVPQQMLKQNSQQGHQHTPIQVSRPPIPQSHAIPPLPRDVNYLLSIIPKAETYHATKFDPSAVVRLIRETHVPTQISQLPPSAFARGGNGQPQPPGPPAQHVPPPPQQHTPHLQGPPQPYGQPGSVPPMQHRPGLPPMPQVPPPVGYPQYAVQAGAPYYGR